MIAKRLNILFIVPDFPLISETFIVNQIIYLLDNGHNVKLLAYNQPNHPINRKVAEYRLIEKTTFLGIPRSPTKKIAKFCKLFFQQRGASAFKSFNIFRFKFSVLTLSPFFKYVALKDVDDNYDIVHAHFGFASELFFDGSFFGFFGTSKLVVTFHGYDMHPGDIAKNRKRYKRLFQHNTLITVNNEYGKALLAKINPNYKNIKLLPVGLDTEYYKPIATKDQQQEVTVLFCGRLIALKGCLLVVEIANALVNQGSRKNMRFNIIGEGEEFDRIEKLIANYNLNGYVSLLGMKTQDEVIHSMKHSDIFILPGITEESGRAETQGLVIQEAQAMELPVIVSDAGGMKYGVLDGITGFVIQENNINKFCDSIALLADNPDLRLKMGCAGREYVKQHFDSQVLGRNLEGYYYKLLAEEDH
ncbi:hypothetical protein GCM10011386_22630 [Parapedobacter defluvii]|uniref:Colanic acid/amylovoran biosynthesis glycosyltransferase n=1 Tax=Parapedobacter defluvii TaxID=2045106 RepID=A0ABQ1LUY9_9SPHI|nr:glycosyltransferase [Parapedobacter defluvii]GGC30071.1 hypothetical protein GCM10011386_22630 [Parapedobacter defluvii]